VKLRIHGNSLRLRLNRTDIEIFQQTGIREEQVRFDSGACLIYALEAATVTAIESEFSGNAIWVRVPVQMARAWATSDQVSLSADSPTDNGPSVLIEKDFQCLHREGENEQDDADAFPNPEAQVPNRG